MEPNEQDRDDPGGVSNVVPLPGTPTSPADAAPAVPSPEPTGPAPGIPAETQAPSGPAPSEPAGPTQLLEATLLVAIGAVSVLAAAAVRLLRGAPGEVSVPAGGTGEEEAVEETGRQPGTDLVGLLAGATFGLAIEATRRGFRAADAVTRTVEPLLSFALSPTFVQHRLRAAETRLATLDEIWQEERPRTEDAAIAFATGLVPEVAEAVLNQLDLTGVVLERVDLDRVIEGIDVDGIVAEVDLDQIAAKIDIEAIVRRLDLAEIAQEVIDELDLPQIIRASTETMTTETVEGLREQSMYADRVVAGVIDRLLRRHERELKPPSDAGRGSDRDEPEGDVS